MGRTSNVAWVSQGAGLSFDDCMNFVFKWEGGYSDHKCDRGGKTNFGITQATLDMARTVLLDAPKEVCDLTKEEAKIIYNRFYWGKCACEYLPEPLNLIVFDSAVNCGNSRAVKWLQEVIGTKADGLAGPMTKTLVGTEIGRVGVRDISRRYIDKRRDFYDDIVERHPNQAVFLKGWMNRVDDLEKVAGMQ